MNKALNEFEVANRLHVAVNTVRNWRCRGQGPPYIKMGGSVRYLEEDLIAYLESKKIIPESMRRIREVGI